MTARLLSGEFSKSKRVLEDQLNRDAAIVHFDDPSPWDDRHFTGEEIEESRSFAVVMDPEKRMRFATVSRERGGKFKVR